LRAVIDDEVRGLEALDTGALKERWLELYGSDPPKGLSAKLMRRAIAYELQVNASGGPKSSIRKTLQRSVSKVAHAESNAAIRIPPGTRLIRQWHGDTYVVDVSEDGVRWKDRSFSSLSAVAREITGARWNGRKFFGVGDGVGAP
jgi:hypothetical protein